MKHALAALILLGAALLAIVGERVEGELRQSAYGAAIAYTGVATVVIGSGL